MSIHDVMAYTNWPLLGQQKSALIYALNGSKPDSEKLEGLLNWIDAIQEAAEKEGLPVVWLYDAINEPSPLFDETPAKE